MAAFTAEQQLISNSTVLRDRRSDGGPVRVVCSFAFFLRGEHRGCGGRRFGWKLQAGFAVGFPCTDPAIASRSNRPSEFVGWSGKPASKSRGAF